jgi:hypothetical protein
MGMSRSDAEKIVPFLRLSNVSIDALKFIPERQWHRTLQWLNDSGLAFYFLQKLRTLKASGAVPECVLSLLEADFAANQRRMADLSERMGRLNSHFQNGDVKFAVLKGFSLVPNYCPDAALRSQGDIDYLIDEPSVEPARQVLVSSGYTCKQTRSSQEVLFYMPGKTPRSRGSEQYSSDGPHSVELHLDIWDGDVLRLPSLAHLFSVERAVVREINGVSFPALDDADAFLIQVLHAMSHVFTQWIKVASLFEIAYFLHQRAEDHKLWNEVEQRAGDNVVLRELVVLVAELAARLFAAPLPYLVRGWASKLRPGARVWSDRYSSRWALGELPVHDIRLFATSKLSVFLHQQYRCEPVKPADGSPAPSAWRVSWIAFALRKNPSLVLNREWWRRHKLPRRCVYYGLAWLRYICEMPRWLWLNGMTVQPERHSDSSGCIRGDPQFPENAEGSA